MASSFKPRLCISAENLSGSGVAGVSSTKDLFPLSFAQCRVSICVEAEADFPTAIPVPHHHPVFNRFGQEIIIKEILVGPALDVIDKDRHLLVVKYGRRVDRRKSQ